MLKLAIAVVAIALPDCINPSLIGGADVSFAGKLLLLVLYCLVFTLPLIVIAAVSMVMGETADGVVRPAGDWLFAHWPEIVGPLTAAVGVGVLAFGLVQLT